MKANARVSGRFAVTKTAPVSVKANARVSGRFAVTKTAPVSVKANASLIGGVKRSGRNYKRTTQQ